MIERWESVKFSETMRLEMVAYGSEKNKHDAKNLDTKGYLILRSRLRMVRKHNGLGYEK